MTERQQDILKLVVEDYISTTQPIGSKYLIDQKGLSLSGATVRNEMRDLENAGFLTHPHTSAGRVPTEAGYKYYVAHLMQPQKLKETELVNIQQLRKSARDQEQLFKTIAKEFAELCHSATIVAFGTNKVYYTGLSQLFSQPEFVDHAMSVSISQIFDAIEDQLENLFDFLDNSEPKIAIGTDNPLGQNCSVVGTRVGQDTVFTVVGPMRMNYQKVFGFVQSLHEFV